MALETCSRCGATLEQDAKFCSQCGLKLEGSAENNQPPYGEETRVRGPNHLLVRQTPAESLLEAYFTDATAQQFADVVHTLVTGKILRPYVMTATATTETVGDVEEIEATTEAPPRIEAPTSPSPIPSVPEAVGGIEAIFTMVNGAPQLDQPILKATSATDYAQRLIRLFLHYMHQHNGMTEVPKREVTKFLNGVGINGGTYRPIISKDTSIQKTKNTFRLIVAGQQQVKRYLEDIDNSEISEGWYPGKDLRAPAPRKRRTGKRDLGHSDTETETPGTWGDDMRQLQDLVKSRHEEVGRWPTGRQALLGLYAMRKVYGDDFETSYQSLAAFLDKTFELQVADDNLRKALERAMKSQTKLINQSAEGLYKVNVAGMRSIEGQLNFSEPRPVRQPELVSVDAVAGPNGAPPE